MYKYQVKKTLSVLIFCSLIFQISSPIAAATSRWTGLGWKLAPLIGLAAGALGWKAYQYKRDKVLKETKQQLPKELQALIGEYALPQEFKRDLIYNIKLLPAILRVSKVTFNSALEHIFKVHGEKNNILHTAVECAEIRAHMQEFNKHRNPDCVIALYATIFVPGDGAGVDVQQVDLLQQQQRNPHNLLVKDDTELHAILGAPLLPGQVALVSYSDGDLRIELTNSDKQALDGLTEKQRKFLDSLYSTQRVIDNGHPTIHFSASEYWNFNSLFNRGQKNCIKEFYNIKHDSASNEKYIAAFFAGLALAGVIWCYSNIFSLCSSSYWGLWDKNWNLNNENALLKNQLRSNNIPLPAGITKDSTMKIGNIIIKF